MDEPVHIEALFQTAVGHHNHGRFADALNGYDAIIRQDPNVALVHSNRGAALSALLRNEEALQSFDRAIELKSDYAEAHNNKANVLLSLRRPDDAVLSYNRAIDLKPDYAEAYYNRGNALRDSGKPDAALISYDGAIALRPGFADAYNNRGNTLKDLQRWDEALASYDKAIALAPHMDFVPGARLDAMLHICDFSGLEDGMAKISAAVREGKKACTPFQMLAISDSAELQMRAAEAYVESHHLNGAAIPGFAKHSRHEKIRLGYFSADYHDHATMHLMAGLFEQHDRSKFELVAFSFGPDRNDDMRARAARAFDRFIDVHDRADADVALMSRAMEVDIAVDLKGFTKANRTGIFACRAAPVQVGYLGYPGTMGADYMDYIVADTILIPEAQRRQYSEKIVYLPNSYQVNDRRRLHSDHAFTRTALGLPETEFVFCCLNNNYKTTPHIFDAWMRVLKQCEGSVLWLLAGNERAAGNLKMEAAARGVSEARLIFGPRVPLSEHLTRLQSADLFLDTFPYNAHTTASEALWAGLPVVTCAGEAFASRVAASLLNAVNLPELVTTTLGDYEALAIELARNPERLAAIKRKLDGTRLVSPLFDTTLFARHIEAAYTTMYENDRSGLAPRDIHVAAA